MQQTTTRPPYQPGDTIRALYYHQGTTLGPVKVTAVEPREDGDWNITAEHPVAARELHYTVRRDGTSDYVSGLALDARDNMIREERAAALDGVNGPRIGDFVRYADGVTERIGAIRDDIIQTSLGEGSFHLGNYGASHSGSLRPFITRDTLTEVEGEARAGAVWFFHDHRQAGNAVETTIPFRVYDCTERAADH